MNIIGVGEGGGGLGKSCWFPCEVEQVRRGGRDPLLVVTWLLVIWSIGDTWGKPCREGEAWACDKRRLLELAPRKAFGLAGVTFIFGVLVRLACLWGAACAWRSEDGSIWVELRLGRSSSSYRIGWALWVSALDASLAVAAAMIFVAVEAMRPCSSPWLTLCWRAALSTGSDTLVYWNVTSLRSWRTSSIGIRADVGKSQVARLRSRGGHPVKLVSVGWASISPSGICAGVVELIWVPLFLTHWWSWEWFGGALDVFENPLWDLSLRALGDWGDLRCPPTWWEEEILRWSW